MQQVAKLAAALAVAAAPVSATYWKSERGTVTVIAEEGPAVGKDAKRSWNVLTFKKQDTVYGDQPVFTLEKAEVADAKPASVTKEIKTKEVKVEGEMQTVPVGPMWEEENVARMHVYSRNTDKNRIFSAAVRADKFPKLGACGIEGRTASAPKCCSGGSCCSKNDKLRANNGEEGFSVNVLFDLEPLVFGAKCVALKSEDAEACAALGSEECTGKCKWYKEKAVANVFKVNKAVEAIQMGSDAAKKNAFRFVKSLNAGNLRFDAGNLTAVFREPESEDLKGKEFGETWFALNDVRALDRAKAKINGKNVVETMFAAAQKEAATKEQRKIDVEKKEKDVSITLEEEQKRAEAAQKTVVKDDVILALPEGLGPKNGSKPGGPWMSLVIITFVIAGLAAYYQASSAGLTSCEKKEQSAEDKAFKKFQMLYLLGWYLCVSGDWLQGFQYYNLPVETFKFSDGDFNKLAAIGFLSSLLFGTMAGALADKFGRRLCCLAYCIIYCIAFVLFHINNFAVMNVARILGGVAQPMLFLVFESWYVQEHTKRGYSGDKIGQTMTYMYFGSSLTAILCGLLGYLINTVHTNANNNKVKYFYMNEALDQATVKDLDGDTFTVVSTSNKFDWFGVAYTGKLFIFEIAFVLVALGFFVVKTMWKDTKEKKRSTKSEEVKPLMETDSEEQVSRITCEQGRGLLQKIAECFSQMRKDTRIPLVGLSVALFEGSMYMMICTWFPVLAFTSLSKVNAPDALKGFDVELNLSTLLSGFLIGSSVFGFCMSKGVKVNVLGWVVMLLAFAGFSMVVVGMHLLDKLQNASDFLFLPVPSGSIPVSSASLAWTLSMLCFVGFIVFEFAIGMYFPTMGTIKATVVEDNCRTTMYNLFQIPMNLAMISVLYAEPSIMMKMTMCTVGTGLALFLMLAFRVMDNAKAKKEEDSSEDDQ